MRKAFTVLCVMFIYSICWGVPRIISYQGKLTDTSGVGIDSDVEITFTIYDRSTDGTDLWQEIHGGVAVSKGLFDVQLGLITPLDVDFSGSEYWLQISVNGDVLLPRQQIVSEVFALRAAYADSCPSTGGGGGGYWTDAGTYLHPNGSIGESLVVADDQSNTFGMMAVTNTGGSSGYGGYFKHSSSGNGSHGIYAEANYTGSDNPSYTYGAEIISRSKNQDQYGIKVVSEHDSSFGFNRGIDVEVDLPSGNHTELYGIKVDSRRDGYNDKNYGVYSYAENGTNVYGVYGQSYDAVGGIGVYGKNGYRYGYLGSTNYGVYGYYDPNCYAYIASDEYGGYFSNINGDGLHNDDNIAYFAYEGNKGGYISQTYDYDGETYGLYVANTNDSSGASDAPGSAAIWAYRGSGDNSKGIGYSFYNGRYAVKGYCPWGEDYVFALGGFVMDMTERYRTGGVIGGSSTDEPPTAWGALGYVTSSETHYGGYGSSDWAFDGGRFRRQPGFEGSTAKAGVGSGWYGGFMGGWFRGDVYGSAIWGERFALYTYGDEYTTGIRASLISDGRTDDRAVGYETISPTASVQMAGYGKLTGGETCVKFPDEFSDLIESGTVPIVAVTPIGNCEGIHINSVNEEGFSVAENGYGTSEIVFSWIAVGIRKGASSFQPPHEILAADFDEHLDGFLFNDRIMDRSGKPMWWDGGKLRFDQVPEESQEIKEQQIRSDPAVIEYLEEQRRLGLIN